MDCQGVVDVDYDAENGPTDHLCIDAAVVGKVMKSLVGVVVLGRLHAIVD